MKKAAVFGMFTALVIVAFAGSCKTAEFGFKVIDINGMVYDFSNRPIPFYEVTLGQKYRGSTDINGRFTLQKVPVGVYAITGNKNGYEDYLDEVIIREKGQIIYIRVPSQNQLLNLVDDYLTANNFILAEEMAERAYRIDKNNIEALLYYATTMFRLKDYGMAVSFLEAAVNLGSKDIYINKFLSILKELNNEEKTN